MTDLSFNTTDLVNEPIVKAMRQGRTPWLSPWNGSCLPASYIDNRAYQGVNAFILNAHSYESPLFMTPHQAHITGHILDDMATKHTLIYYEKACFSARTGELLDTLEIQKLPKEAYKERWVLKEFLVSNILEVRNPSALPYFMPPRRFDRDQLAMVLKKAKNKPAWVKSDNDVFYHYKQDKAFLKEVKTYENEQEFYYLYIRTLMHSTAHASRLNRGVHDAHDNRSSYLFEQMVITMATALVCGKFHIDISPREKELALVPQWLQLIEEDPTCIMRAAAKARQAANYFFN